MRKQVLSTLLLLLAIGIFGLTYGTIQATEDGGKEAAEQRVIGTWKLVSAKYGDQALDLATLGTTLKHVTPTGFMWLSYDATTRVVSRTAGGTYTLKGDKYEETPQYGLGGDFDTIRDKVQAFKLRIEGDTWHHDGALRTAQKSRRSGNVASKNEPPRFSTTIGTISLSLSMFRRDVKRASTSRQPSQCAGQARKPRLPSVRNHDAGTDHEIEIRATFDREGGATRGVRMTFKNLAQAAAPLGPRSSVLSEVGHDPCRDVAWRGRPGQAFVLREPGVRDGTTANSLAADRRGRPPDDRTAKTKLLTGSCWRILDQGLALEVARSSITSGHRGTRRCQSKRTRTRDCRPPPVRCSTFCTECLGHEGPKMELERDPGQSRRMASGRSDVDPTDAPMPCTPAAARDPALEHRYAVRPVRGMIGRAELQGSARSDRSVVYLEDMLELLQTHSDERLDELLPDYLVQVVSLAHRKTAT